MAADVDEKNNMETKVKVEKEYKPVTKSHDASNEFDEPDDGKSTGSEASEIARIADVSLSDDVASYRDIPNVSENINEDEILRIIRETKSTSIDLSKRKLQAIPEALASLPYLEYIYLEGNQITSLPDHFFKMFPCLRWLDLRNNALKKLPSAYLSSHTCLRNLLLEGNNLRSLPLELGLMKNLHGLNIAGNPLDFPPPEIIENGTQYILVFLREMFAKSVSEAADLELELSKDVPDGYENISASSDDWNTTASMMDLAKKRTLMQTIKSELNQNHGCEAEQKHLSGTKPGMHSLASYCFSEKTRKTGSQGTVDKIKKKDSRTSWKIRSHPVLASENYIAYKADEDKRIARVKKLNAKTEALLQKQKNEVAIKKWRDDTKLLQQEKYMKHMLPGKDYTEPGEQAPFGIDKEMMKVLSKEDRLKRDLQKEAELRLKRTVSPATRMRLEQEKQIRIHELEQRIKVHTAAMIHRRKQSKGSPQQELELARRELDIVSMSLLAGMSVIIVLLISLIIFLLHYPNKKSLARYRYCPTYGDSTSDASELQCK